MDIRFRDREPLCVPFIYNNLSEGVLGAECSEPFGNIDALIAFQFIDECSTKCAKVP
ncbi:hypothetical protein SAMN04487991_0009 [Celeribacter neptunius]|uniref:Uncharacterized protein n=1 Tax=Celeribacter neptunius TaxID=588602 RepID=A0A1I3IHQ6_9RHOB|nr:hypothetical protein SAMN04487991_0009 [Celeribacter neptunius]